MTDFAEQHAALKFCFLLGKNAAEAIDLLSVAYKEHSLKKSQVYEWFSRFKKGDLSLERRPGSGPPVTARTDENIEKIRVLVYEDRRRTFDELAEMTGLSWSSFEAIAQLSAAKTARFVGYRRMVPSP